ncbi:MAG: hypothetical protein PHO37_02670 [Kiritimatiellae bacterium]|nr:hypothetical protein [Kiritimatiellia bacterium]
MAELRKESEHQKMYDQSTVWTAKGWYGMTEQNFTCPNEALRSKLLRAMGGREARALEKEELRRIEEQNRRSAEAW